jgi:signal transduction histidine kinase/ligand-binding sensor domain-containing protein
MKPVIAHVNWTGRDGAPGNIAAIAQTTDGYLWLGTPFGLYRFDGLEFSSYPMTTLETKLPAADIDSLAADPDGGLWIGFRLSGGITHLSRNGVVTNYGGHGSAGPNAVQKILVRGDGSVWAIADNKLLVLRGDRWEDFGKAKGLPNDPLGCLFFDSRGNLWTSMRNRLFVLRPGGKSFDLYPTQTLLAVDMAEMPNGTLWLSDGWRTIRPLEPTPSKIEIRVPSYTRMLVEPSGTVWLAQDYRGVSHFHPNESSDALGPLVQEAGVSSEQTNAIFRDRDGDIWVGTSRGLDRFHSSPLQALTNVRVEYYPAMSGDAHRGVWIAMLSHPLIRADGDSLSPVGREVGSSPIVCDDNGRVWLVDPIFNQLTEYEQGKMTRFPVPEEVHRTPAQSIGLDYDGKLLVSFEEFGLWRFDGRWSRIDEANRLPGHPLTIFRDDERHVWLGYPDGGIAIRDGSGFHTFPAMQGAGLGNVLTFAISRNTLWVGGANGIAYMDHGVFRTAAMSRDTALHGVSGIAEDASHNLWLNTSAGIVHIRASQLDKLTADAQPLDYEVIDDRQGVQGTATEMKPTPSAVADKSGLLWFSMSGAVYSIHPQDLSIHETPISLMLQRVILNGVPVLDREHEPTSLVTSAASLKDLEIDYVGLDLPSPEKVAYQYRLEGEDRTWHDVGNRHQAFYTRLRPGSYRFHVRAWDGTSQWRELVAPLAITITPAFYQSAWFYIVSAIVAMGFLYLIYLLRVYYLTSLLKDRLQQRSDERMRIARALHDTLLQSVHGLMLRFHFAAQALPEQALERKSLEAALVRADAVYLEARSQVESLRDDAAQGPNLVSLIAKRAEELDVQQSMTFQIVENGLRQPLHRMAQSELYRIASEALSNTLLHARAPSAEVVLTYGGSEFLMKCCDKGIGLPPHVLEEGQREGHWGLIGMRERAAALEGKLQIWSAPNSGTEIEVRIPARRAYVSARPRIVWLQRLLQLRRAATGLDTDTEPEP